VSTGGGAAAGEDTPVLSKGEIAVQELADRKFPNDSYVRLKNLDVRTRYMTQSNE